MPDKSQAQVPAPSPAPVPTPAPIPAPAPAPFFSPPPVQVKPVSPVQSIESWAQAKSMSDRRVELLSAFVAITRRKVARGTPAEFEAAFRAFANAAA